MSTKTICVLILLLSLNSAAAARQTVRENAASGQDASRQADAESHSGETPDLRTDVEKMRTLLGQMQRNVAFVSAGDTPLKHQLQLEIEMWELLLRDMEKKAAVLERH
jgi:hypothetical protein